MKVELQMKKEEAIRRMEALVKELELNPKLNEIKEGIRYCSNIDRWDNILYPIEEDPDLVELVEQLETKRKAYVYHVIEAGTMLVFLYVNDYEETWEYDRYSPEGGYISAYVYNMLYPELSEPGDVFICGEKGAIKRVA